MGKRTLGAAQIGHAHGRKHLAAELVGGKGDRNAQDRTFDSRLGAGFPEGFAALEKFKLVTAAGQGDGSDFFPRFCTQPGRGKHWQMGHGVPAQKVEDVVTAGIDARPEGRPSHRRHGRPGGAQGPEAAFVFQAGQVRQFPLVHHLPGDDRIQPVQTQDHDSLDLRVFQPSAAAQ